MTRIGHTRDIERLYAERGALSYGEGVTQMEHALQCADLAEAQGGSPALVLAALLHDIGHLFVDEQTATASDDRHEAMGAEALAGLYGEAVCAPIALHVQAKRYLCFKEPGYFERLSAASKRSLGLQGGPLGAAQAQAFEGLPHWREATLLRRYDDWGKREERTSRAFADFAPLMRSLVID